MALVVAWRHPGVDLVGISVVGGDEERRLSEARHLLGPGVPVHADASGADVESARPDVVLAIGPLTNLARWWHPSAPPLPLVAMGGALDPVEHRSEIREVETNFGLDPAAAAWLLSAGGEVTLVPLDVTARMVVSEEQADALAAARPELSQALAGWPHPLCLHDPLALLVALGEVEVSTEERSLDVQDDGRVVLRDGAPVVAVVVDADVDAAKRAVLRACAGGRP